MKNCLICSKEHNLSVPFCSDRCSNDSLEKIIYLDLKVEKILDQKKDPKIAIEELSSYLEKCISLGMDNTTWKKKLLAAILFRGGNSEKKR